MEERCHSTSAPAQNEGPSPASTTARASPTSANASVSSRISSASNAFRRSGFASVTRSTAPSRSIRSPAIAPELTQGAPPGPRLRLRPVAPPGSIPLRGALAAALTPLRDGGARLDEDAFEPYAAFLLAGRVGGILAGGTTGEGISLDPDERLRSVELFARAGLNVIAHCGAQTTATTVRLAAGAGEAGAAAVAVIAPPYFRLDEEALLAHFDGRRRVRPSRCRSTSTSSRRPPATRCRPRSSSSCASAFRTSSA